MSEFDEEEFAFEEDEVTPKKKQRAPRSKRTPAQPKGKKTQTKVVTFTAKAKSSAPKKRTAPAPKTTTKVAAGISDKSGEKKTIPKVSRSGGRKRSNSRSSRYDSSSHSSSSFSGDSTDSYTDEEGQMNLPPMSSRGSRDLIHPDDLNATQFSSMLDTLLPGDSWKQQLQQPMSGSREPTQQKIDYSKIPIGERKPDCVIF